jgi:NTP pyrophosphatase (non-canonical NTP hydrolase)
MTTITAEFAMALGELITVMPDITREVLEEMTRQEVKFPDQRHTPPEWYAILGEEVGEVARAINDADPDAYRAEVIHVAAVALRMALEFDRNIGKLPRHRVPAKPQV